MPTAPIIHAVSHAVVKDASLTYPIPDVSYTHILVCALVDVWVKPGDSTVTCAPGDTGATFFHGGTMVEIPSRRMQVDGLTHIAVYGTDKDGLLNLNYENAIVTELDCLAGIYHMMREQLIRQFGEPGYSPQHPPFKSHVDW